MIFLFDGFFLKSNLRIRHTSLFYANSDKATSALEAAHMAPEELKSKFGGRLAFHGCISTAAIAKLDEAGVETLCRNTLEILMPTHAYAFSPTHQIQDNTPIQNVIRMYQTAHTYGVYK